MFITLSNIMRKKPKKEEPAKILFHIFKKKSHIKIR